MRTFAVDLLQVEVHPDRPAMGLAAASEGLRLLRRALAKGPLAHVVFAAAPSQQEMLHALCEAKDVDWGRVHAYHMDNYIGLDDTARQQFSAFLKARIFGRLPFGAVHYMGNRPEQARDYADLLAKIQVDLCFMGVGENGHIAFNDPGNAFFDDPESVKTVTLDHACRMQQVNEGNFAALEHVPTQALTLTIPALMASRHIICTVPGINKAPAVRRMLQGPVDEGVPASILRRHPAARLYLDQPAASLLAAPAR